MTLRDPRSGEHRPSSRRREPPTWATATLPAPAGNAPSTSAGAGTLGLEEQHVVPVEHAGKLEVDETRRVRPHARVRDERRTKFENRCRGAGGGGPDLDRVGGDTVPLQGGRERGPVRTGRGGCREPPGQRR